jgi:glycosyltransferase involved in cell wall biosynthesis
MENPDARIPRIAILIPCFNEATTIGQVITEFRQALPMADIYVGDNNSSDETAQVARENGAIVQAVGLQGKGNVVRRQFADIEADVYLLVDGDATYSAAAAPHLIDAVLAGNDMVVGAREASEAAAYRAGHVFGNRVLTGFLSWLFGRSCRDILSGYRAFSRRFVKSFPADATGFEIETELTVHALELRVPIAEIATPYVERPEGSFSKLNTWKDGLRILRTMLTLFSTERPIAFYGSLGGVLSMASVLLALPLLATYLGTGLVPRFPTAVLAASLMTLAVLSFLAGVILHAIAKARREVKALAYLRIPKQLNFASTACCHRP